MPSSQPTLTRPMPRPAPAAPVRHLATPDTGPARGSTITAQLVPWNYTGRVYIAFDPPTAANPAWIEVTQFVDLQKASIQITRGRQDGESDPQVGTCSLTVWNDGRWSLGNSAGAWAGQIDLGSWLRVDLLPPSGTVSTRFVGFIQQLPVTWDGDYSTTQISASDRFVLLGNAPAYQSAIFHEWMSDPVGAQYIVGYWPLHDPQGATYVSDASGMAPASQAALAVRSQGTNFGSGVTFNQTNGPGYDGLQTVSFAPNTPLANTGAMLNGSYLQGTVGPTGYVSQTSVWVNTTVTLQPIFSWADPSTNYSLIIGIDAAGFLSISQEPLSGSSTTIGAFALNGIGQYPIADGVWHQVSVKVQAAGAPPGGGSSYFGVFIDGIAVLSALFGTNPLTNVVPPTTLSRLTVGGGEALGVFEGYVGTPLFTGSLSDLVVHVLPTAALNVDWYGPYQAGTAMWQSPGAAYSVPESCGRRVLRLAQYAGVQVPTGTFGLPNFAPLTASDVVCGVTPFVNIPGETAHPAALQQISGQKPLQEMQTAAHTENMPLFIDRQGRITLQPSTLRQNPIAAFTIDARDLDPSTEWANDFQYLQNQTIVTPSGQGSLTVNINGVASQAKRGLYSDGVDTVTINSVESASLGAAINAAGASPQPRHNPLACEVATLAMQAGYGNNWYDAVLAAEISTVVQVVNWPAESPGGPSGSYYIEGYTETIGAGNHLFAWSTSPVQGPTYQLDSPTLGLLDTPGITLAY